MKKHLSLLILLGVFAGSTLLFTQCDSQGGGTQSETAANATEEGGTVVSSSIAYITLDSLANNYTFWVEQMEDLEGRAQKLQTEFENRVKGLQQEVANLQAAAQNRTMTNNQLAAAEENLMGKQQNLQQYQASIQRDVAQMEAEMMNDIYEKISAFLKKYGEEQDLELILTYQRGSGVWYAKEGMNITEEVIEGLNKAYEMEKNGGAPATDTPADSTAQ